MEHAAAMQTTANEAAMHSNLETAIHVLRDRSAQLDRFEKGVLVKLPELRQLAEVAYRNGQATILDLLDTFRTESERRATHLALIEAVMQAEVDVLAASGNVEWHPQEERP